MNLLDRGLVRGEARLAVPFARNLCSLIRSVLSIFLLEGSFLWIACGLRVEDHDDCGNWGSETVKQRASDGFEYRATRGSATSFSRAGAGA